MSWPCGPLASWESGLVIILFFYVHGGLCLAILQRFLEGLVGELLFLEVLEHSPTMDQVVVIAFIGALEVLQGFWNLQGSWNGGHSYNKTLEPNLLA
jgi:ABC-type enterochelin transport system permease subunit